MMKKVIFEWDDNKNETNHNKHGVLFNEAEYAFLDRNRIIAEDVDHSLDEKRYYCFGMVNGEVMTVRFTYRNNQIRIIGAGYWRKGKKYMKKRSKVKYTDEPIGKIKIIPDFLPSPENLILKEETVKITILLSKSSVDFFKHMASKKRTQYQKMIRALIDQYASHYK